MNPDQLRVLLLIAALSYAPTLAFFYVGEEAIFPISSLEMWHGRDWFHQHLFGLNLQHNPLFNWLIIPFAALIGWEYMLPVTRALTIAATLGTAAATAWLAWQLTRDRAFAAFAALLYLTLADVLFYRGWLAYVDPLFGFFVFGAIAALWVACEDGRRALLAVAVASLTCAFLSKAFTAYVFYGAAALVLMIDPRRRRVLLGGTSLALHAGALLAPAAWLWLVVGDQGQGTRMLSEIIVKLAPAGVLEYLRHLAGFPVETMLRLSPAFLLAGYYVWRRRIAIAPRWEPHWRAALWIACLNYLPYWLSPHGSIRYLVPLYPVIALALAMLLWSADAQALRNVRHWLAGAIALKLVAVLLFPLYQSHYRGENYALAAQRIIERTAGHSLYTTNDTASGLSVAGYIDAWRHPAPPLQWMPRLWESGFVIAEAPDTAVGEVVEKFRLGRNELFLLCRGAACAQPR